MKYYSQSHEWIEVEKNEGSVGISTHAQEELGEIVYVELPGVGVEVKRGDEVAVLESTKAASDIYSPVSGTIIAVNEKVKEDPSLLNSAPEKEGWLYKIALSKHSELDSLLDHEQYFQLK